MQTIRTLFWRSDFTYFLVSLFRIITVTKVCEVKKLPVKYKLQRSCNELLLWFKKLATHSAVTMANADTNYIKSAH